MSPKTMGFLVSVHLIFHFTFSAITGGWMSLWNLNNVLQAQEVSMQSAWGTIMSFPVTIANYMGSFLGMMSWNYFTGGMEILRAPLSVLTAITVYGGIITLTPVFTSVWNAARSTIFFWQH